jgi:hypothetical protein
MFVQPQDSRQNLFRYPGFNPEEVLRKLAEHRFRSEGKFRKSEFGLKREGGTKVIHISACGVPCIEPEG